jgi:ABC-type transport system involved in multi-copper enzyme maturation permease subunit
MKNVAIGGLVGFLVGVMFILFSSMYSSYAAENEITAALTTIFLWIIFGAIVAVILELCFPKNKTKKEE